MEKKFVKMICIQERTFCFGGSEGNFYLLDENSIEKIGDDFFGEFYDLNKNLIGFWNIARFREI